MDNNTELHCRSCDDCITWMEEEQITLACNITKMMIPDTGEYDSPPAWCPKLEDESDA